VELTGAGAVHAPLPEVNAVGRELLDSLTLLIGHVDASGSVRCDAEGVSNSPGRIRTSPTEAGRCRSPELLDAVVTRVGDVDVADGVHGDAVG